MTEQPQAPPTQEIFGIAKKMALELEKLPLHTHAGIINMVRTMVEHRKIELESKANEAQVEAQKAAYADALQAHAKAQVQREEDEKVRAEKQARRAQDPATGGLALVDATGQPYPETTSAQNVAQKLSNMADDAMARGDHGVGLALLEQAKDALAHANPEAALVS